MAASKSYGIYHNLIVHAEKDLLFRAIADPDELEKWWPLKCSGHQAVGAQYNFYFGPEYDWLGEVVTYNKGAAFYIKMLKADPDWNPTIFGFDLTEQGNGIKLQFSHTGWPHRNDHFKTASFCWALLLKGLKDYVETGKIIPFNARS